MINKNKKIFLTGHKGLLGSAVLRKLKSEGFKKIITIEKKKLNFLDQKKTFEFIKKKRPNFVIICAGRVGGINVNQKMKSNFIYENLQIQNNLIHGSFIGGVKNLIFLGSSCIYPKKTKIPISEDSLLSGPLEETNDAYAIAKIAGMKMCQSYSENHKLNYKTLMPCNLYGSGDNYDLIKSHFYPALIRKIYTAKIKKRKNIEVWGSGLPKRELMHVDDAANAIVFFMKKKIKENFLNIGSGKDFSINWYVNFIMKKLNVKLKIKKNKKMPDGVLRKLLDSSKANKYGWKPKISLDEGFFKTFQSLKKDLY